MVSFVYQLMTDFLCHFCYKSTTFLPKRYANIENVTSWKIDFLLHPSSFSHRTLGETLTCPYGSRFTNKGKIGTIWYIYVQLVETHFLISLAYHSSSRWNPQKCLPSPPKSQGLITSKDFKGRRCAFPWCNNTCAFRRNLRLLACFPFFCDLQQHHVLTGIRFLLLLIVS